MLDIILRGIVNSAPLALATLGVAIIFKTSYTTNFAQGMIGAISTFVVTRIIYPTPDIQGNVPETTMNLYLLAILIGIIVGTGIATLLDVLVFRKAKFTTPVSKQIITMGLVLIISGLIPLSFGVIDRSLPRLGELYTPMILRYPVYFLQWLFGLLGFNLLFHAGLAFFVSSVIIAAVFLALRYTKWGLGVRATASNERVASMMGVNTKVITAASWAIAGGLASLAAIFISSARGTFGNVNSYFMVTVQIQAFFAAILGGFATFYGPVIGIVLFSIFNNVFSVYFNPWGITVTYLSILLIVLVKPNGLFGKRIAKKV